MTCALIYRGNDILLCRDENDKLSFPVVDINNYDNSEIIYFETDGTQYAVLPEKTAETIAGGVWRGLRESWGELEPKTWNIAAKGAELAHFMQTNRFCGTCGTALVKASDISRRCPACKREFFPSLSPAIIVLVTRGEEALLVHAKSFRRPFYALVAGFVETGETIEECVAREIYEETSLRVTDIRYFGSQSWPFPSQLMLGFTARYASGRLRWADGELSDGGFFTRESHPLLPSLPSISRRLIDAWLNGEIGGK
ncbi:MAG: NAD(+) diphosphatase [Muribaculaceae bacterium]|nr:NAD(+) diphosphatase [Muribaculaceae bacterium]